MKLTETLKVAAGLAVVVGMAFCFSGKSGHKENSEKLMTTQVVLKQDVEAETYDLEAQSDQPIEQPGDILLCQGYDEGFGGNPYPVQQAGMPCDDGCAVQQEAPAKMMLGVDENTRRCGTREPGWKNQRPIPFEKFAYGEYIGPHRTPHVGEYRIRVNDQLEFVYLLTRERSSEPYQLYVGDQIQISSAIDASLNQREISILSDGTISLSLIGQVRAAGKTVGDLQEQLNDKYSEFVKNPAIVVGVTKGDTPLEDVRDAVDARQGSGGQVRQALVSPDGTIQLPLVGSIPAVGLTLEEIRREVNARYRSRVRGIEVTPILVQRAPRFIFVVGEVGQPGRFEMTGPTTVMQAIALAEGFNTGGNLRQAIVFRRDQNWKLVATRLDLQGALLGKRPHPSDDIWLRDSDIVLVPKKPVQRLSEGINQYFSSTLFSIFPAELGSFDAGAVIAN